MAGSKAAKQNKLIRDFGVPRDNVNGKGGSLTTAQQREIADGARTQNGKIGGSS